MQQPISNDQLDDLPDRVEAAGFTGYNSAINPTLLDPSVLADGKNVWTRGDGYMETRPALRLNTTTAQAGLQNGSGANKRVTALGYFDVQGYEATIVFTDDRAYAVTGSGDNVVATAIVATPPYITAKVGSPVIQLVDRIFYLDTFGQITWLLYTAGTWTKGSVVAWSNSVAMPSYWSTMVTLGFRLLVVEQNGYYIYASAIGQAHTAADWVQTENVRVGSGEGDPARAVLASQGRYLTLLNQRSAFQIDTTEANVADWSTLQVSKAIGCIAGRTAVAIGQDVLFLSRHGVVNLGALSDVISIAPQNTLSAPILPLIDRINMAAIDTAFAVSWRQYYLLAVPLDNETQPTRFLPLNVNTNSWMPPWVISNSAHVASGVPAGSFNGISHAVVVNFNDKSETLVADNLGNIQRLDDTQTQDQCAISFAASAPYAPTISTVDIPAYVRTKSFTHDVPTARKHPFIVETELGNATADPIYVYLRADGTVSHTTNSFANPTLVGLAAGTNAAIERSILNARNNTLVQPVQQYYECAVQLSCNSARLRVRSIALNSFVNSPLYT